ncbi:hypothetical protein [Rhizobacter sp. LjRoot28]|uniref:hypothetical protein n=1 Tax=Rhizobacter sp. LjRoot28 TaxID=3342309 RepID=UPI003ECF5227
MLSLRQYDARANTNRTRSAMNFRSLSVALPIVLTACASQRPYEIPPTVTDRAHLQVEFAEESVLSGAVRVDRRIAAHSCDGALMNPLFVDSEQLVVVSKGNPLLSNLNLTGVWIPAGEKAVLAIMSLRDARSCSSVVAFDSVKDRRYALRVGAPGAGAQCPLQLVQRSASGEDSSEIPVMLEQLACVPRGAARPKPGL